MFRTRTLPPLFLALATLALLPLPAPAAANSGGTPLAPLPPPLAVDAELAALGRLLFADSRLSGDTSLSCSSCHLAGKGWADGLALAGGYPGALYFRNTPTVVNSAYQRHAYWDGRLNFADLDTVVRDHIAEAHFMQADGRLVSERLRQAPGYTERFQALFGSEPRYGGILKSISAYLRSLRAETALDRHLRGEASLPAAAARGLGLFTGKAGCSACHGGALLTDGAFRASGAPGNEDIWRVPERHETCTRRSEMRLILLLGLLALTALPLRAGDIDFSGVSFLEYNRQLDGTAEDGTDAFDVKRVYLTAKTQLGEHSYFRYTTDIGRFNGNSSLAIRTKYAYFGWKPQGGGEFRFGLVGLPWNGSEDKMWNHRFAHKSVGDLEKWLDSADFGALWTQTTDSGFFYTLYIANGEGYTGSPSGTGEVYGAYTGFRFDNGLEIAGFHQDGEEAGSPETDRQRTLGRIAYRADSWLIAAVMGTGEGFGSADDTELGGFWVYGSVDIAEDWDFFWRWAETENDPVGAGNSVEKSALIFGLTRQLDDNLRAALDVSLATFDDKTDPTRADEDTFYVHFEAKLK